jgi:hypothetical protein
VRSALSSVKLFPYNIAFYKSYLNSISPRITIVLAPVLPHPYSYRAAADSYCPDIVAAWFLL